MTLTSVVATEGFKAPQVLENESLADYLLSERSVSVLNTLLEPQAIPLFHRAIRTLMLEQSDNFKDATPKSVFLAVARTASLGLRLDRDFGHVWLIPYTSKGTTSVQLQIGYKGLIFQLIRSGRFKSINACSVYKNDNDETIKQRLFGIRPPSTDPKTPIEGFCAGYITVDGYTDYEYMSVEEMNYHKMTYSQSSDSDYSPWKKAYIQMAQKTVLKRLINRSAIHHALINTGVTVPIMETLSLDQAVIHDDNISYADNPTQDGENTTDKAQSTSTQVIDLTNNPSRFESLVSAVKSGRYSAKDALDPAKIILTPTQTMILQSVTSATPINLSKDATRFGQLLDCLEQGRVSFDTVKNSALFTLSKAQKTKVDELQASLSQDITDTTAQDVPDGGQS